MVLDGEEVAQGTNPLDDSSNPGVNTGSFLFNPFRRLNVAGARGTGGGRNGFYGVGQSIALSSSVNEDFQSISPLGWQTQSIIINPRNRDSDQDGMPDWWEETHGLDLFVDDSAVDSDSDGLSNLQEFSLKTSPLNEDTDGDGLSDFVEVNTHSSNPLVEDTDEDGFSDMDEVLSGNSPISGSDYPGVIISSYQASGYQLGVFGGNQSVSGISSFSIGGGSFSESIISSQDLVSMTGLLFSTSGELNPSVVDSDGDGMPDSWENVYGLNSLLNDSAQDGDGDGLTNIQEFALLTNPLRMDSDLDGISDGDESGQ